MCAPVGVFTVVRGQSFAGHAFADVTATGGSAAFLLGVSPLLGFVVMALAGAGATELLGAERQRGREPRDRGPARCGPRAIGATALLDDDGTKHHRGSRHGPLRVDLRSQQFDLADGDRLRRNGAVPRRARIPPLAPELDQPRPGEGAGRRAPCRRARLRRFLGALRRAVRSYDRCDLEHCSAHRPRRRSVAARPSPPRAIAWAVVIGIAATWAGIVFAYDSYNWPPAQQGWPVSFFVVRSSSPLTC